MIDEILNGANVLYFVSSDMAFAIVALARAGRVSGQFLVADADVLGAWPRPAPPRGEAKRLTRGDKVAGSRAGRGARLPAPLMGRLVVTRSGQLAAVVLYLKAARAGRTVPRPAPPRFHPQKVRPGSGFPRKRTGSGTAGEFPPPGARAPIGPLCQG